MGPNFICVGAAKAGSTWLHLCLSEHPEVFVPPQKEIRFFSNPELLERGVTWYESLYADSGAALAVGDISGSYMMQPAVPRRIHDYRPDMRLLFLLRHPVHRAVSHYRMDLRTGDVVDPMEMALTVESDYVRRGLYHEHLSRFLAVFPMEQVHITFHDDISSDPLGVVSEIYRFLGVDESFAPRTARRSVNEARELPRFPRTYRALRRAYGHAIDRSQFLQDALESRRLDGRFDSVHRLNAGGDLPQIQTATHEKLVAYFEADVNALAELVDRDLDHWLR